VLFVASLRRVRAKIAACASRIGRVKVQRIELVVAHHSPRLAGVDQAPHGAEHARVLRPPVDEVAEKVDLAGGLVIGPAAACDASLGA
jgi:hypothetical protein